LTPVRKSTAVVELFSTKQYVLCLKEFQIYESQTFANRMETNLLLICWHLFISIAQCFTSIRLNGSYWQCQLKNSKL